MDHFFSANTFGMSTLQRLSLTISFFPAKVIWTFIATIGMNIKCVQFRRKKINLKFHCWRQKKIWIEKRIENYFVTYVYQISNKMYWDSIQLNEWAKWYKEKPNGLFKSTQWKRNWQKNACLWVKISGFFFVYKNSANCI